MTIKKTNKGTVSVSHRGAVVADSALIAAIAQVSNMRATKRECTKAEDAAKVAIKVATGDRARLILNVEGDIICEVKEVATTSVSVDGFLEALEGLYPDIWATLMDRDPKAVETAKIAATKHDTYLKVLPK
jgi:hypothetical protein